MLNPSGNVFPLLLMLDANSADALNRFIKGNVFPLLVLLVVGLVVGIAFLALSSVLGPKRPGTVKNQPYECGIDPVGDARLRFSVKFYIIAMLFILFDIEAIFLYPWAVMFKQLRLFGLMEMLVFLGLLVIGYVYLWRRGALEWE